MMLATNGKPPQDAYARDGDSDIDPMAADETNNNMSKQRVLSNILTSVGPTVCMLYYYGLC